MVVTRDVSHRERLPLKELSNNDVILVTSEVFHDRIGPYFKVAAVELSSHAETASRIDVSLREMDDEAAATTV